MTKIASVSHAGTSLQTLARRFLPDRNGVAAVEFAFVLPVMLACYFGVTEIAQAVMVNRKVTQLTRALSDLTTQLATITDGERDNIFNAAQTVMAPYTRVAPKMALASIVIDSSRVARVCWSESKNGAEVPKRGDTVILPEALRISNTSVIMARASYDFTPAIGYAITGTIEIGDNMIYTRPRLGQAVGSASIEQVVRSSQAPCPGF